MTSCSSLVDLLTQPLLVAHLASTVPRTPSENGTVMAYTQGLRGFSSQHEQLTRMEIVRRIARIKGYAVGDESSQQPAGQIYLVPSDTLVGVEHAAALGARHRDDLLGGVVPHAFVATKAISHPLVAPGAVAPEGWRPDFHAAIFDTVLPGYSVFSVTDAREAGRRLLDQQKVVRVKLVHETGGRGQTVVHDEAGLEACLAQCDADSTASYGLVIEQNLEPVDTLSVGQVVIAGITASYFGKQHLVVNNRGREVYGGSELTVVRGDFAQLLDYALAQEIRIAVEQALIYDGAVATFYPGFFASRINYDVAQGRDAAGVWQSGVLEQSWRVGGATGAEIAALEILAADASRNRVRTRCVEAYGHDVQVPDGAAIYFQGVDDSVGAITKYAMVLPDVDAT